MLQVKDRENAVNENPETNQDQVVPSPEEPKGEVAKDEIDFSAEYLRRTATRGLTNTDFEESEPRWGTARFNERTTLLLSLTSSTGLKKAFRAVTRRLSARMGH